MSVYGVLLGVIFLLYYVTSVTSVQCYDCSGDYELPVTALSLTADTLEAYVPSDCLTNLTPNNQSRCEFVIIVHFWRQHPTLRTILITFAQGDGSFPIQPFTGQHKARITLQSGLSDGIAAWANSYSIYYTYECATDRCNSWENMRAMINATTVTFNYNSVMTQLYQTTSSGTVIPCLIYSNVTSVSDCSFCQATSSLPCKTCQIQTCDKHSCASCNPNSSTLVYLSHYLAYDYISNKHSMRLEYNCNKPDCNSFEKQSEIKSLYTMRLDLGREVNSSSVMMAAETLGRMFLLLLCWCIFGFD